MKLRSITTDYERKVHRRGCMQLNTKHELASPWKVDLDVIWLHSPPQTLVILLVNLTTLHLDTMLLDNYTTYVIFAMIFLHS